MQSMLLLGEFEGIHGKTLKLQAVIELDGIFNNIYIYIYIYIYIDIGINITLAIHIL